MAIAISATFSLMDRAIAAACATASIRLHCASCRATRWWSRVTVNISTRWRTSDDDRTCCSRRGLLLGHAGPHPQAARCDLDPCRVYGWRRVECDISQSRHPCRGDRDHLRSLADHLSPITRVLFPDPRSDDAQPSGE